MTSSFPKFMNHTRRTTFGRTPLDEWSARCRDPYLKTHNTHNRQTIHVPGGIRAYDLSSGERQQTYWDRHKGWIDLKSVYLCLWGRGEGWMEESRWLVSVLGLRRNTCMDITRFINLCKISINC
jgi:hypothetical protein